jgi:hypothetical protein
MMWLARDTQRLNLYLFIFIKNNIERQKLPMYIQLHTLKLSIYEILVYLRKYM